MKIFNSVYFKRRLVTGISLAALIIIPLLINSAVKQDDADTTDADLIYNTTPAEQDNADNSTASVIESGKSSKKSDSSADSSADSQNESQGDADADGDGDVYYNNDDDYYSAESPSQSYTPAKDIILKSLSEYNLALDLQGILDGSAAEDYTLPSSYKINVNCVYQDPELPTGCEITALTTVLNHLGYSVSKTTMAYDYLIRAEYGKATFYQAFIGDPSSSSGYGCYSPVIAKTAENYLDANGDKHSAIDISGTDFDTLLTLVSMDVPVVTWCTMSLIDTYSKYVWTLPGGADVYWTVNEHCVVLIGYDLDAGTVTVSDPQKGIVKYDLSLFRTRYEQIFQQAVVVIENSDESSHSDAETSYNLDSVSSDNSHIESDESSSYTDDSSDSSSDSSSDYDDSSDESSYDDTHDYNSSAL